MPPQKQKRLLVNSMYWSVSHHIHWEPTRCVQLPQVCLHQLTHDLEMSVDKCYWTDCVSESWPLLFDRLGFPGCGSFVICVSLSQRVVLHCFQGTWKPPCLFWSLTYTAAPQPDIPFLSFIPQGARPFELCSWTFLSFHSTLLVVWL